MSIHSNGSSYSNSTTTYTDCGVSAPITPATDTTPVRVQVSINRCSVDRSNGGTECLAFLALYRDAVELTDARFGFAGAGSATWNLRESATILFEDMPGVDTEVTYTLKGKAGGSNITFSIPTGCAVVEVTQ